MDQKFYLIFQDVLNIKINSLNTCLSNFHQSILDTQHVYLLSNLR